MTLVAIDFETANEQRSSPCAVGLAWFEGGQLVNAEHYMIRPPEMRFSAFNTAIHGISAGDVMDAPEFPELFETLIPLLQGARLVAHNAAFDMSVIRATCDRYAMAYPETEYLCTLKAARIAWPDFASHKLDVLCRAFTIALKHHDAGSDAIACGHLGQRIAAETGAADFAEASSALGISNGVLRRDSYQPCSLRR